ncbi:MAG: hypothetical protein K0M49_08010 [Arenimonas sp.]|nr:hypothetical protein [Rhizobium sp.]MBW8445561.1 hypothetical protein [Arenimonas sp.]
MRPLQLNQITDQVEFSAVLKYEPNGVKVLSSHQVGQMKHNSLAGIQPRTTTGFTGRILDCYAGSRAWGIPSAGDRRKMVAERLLEVRASNLLDIKLKKRIDANDEDARSL